MTTQPAEPLKTITIGLEEDPEFTLCPGHVSAETFSHAMAREGWDLVAVEEDQLSFEWWQASPDGWEPCLKHLPDARPFTVLAW